MLHDVVLVFADTTRSRVYAQALVAAGLLPPIAIILESITGLALPGQSTTPIGVESCVPEWGRFKYDLSEPLGDALLRGGAKIKFLGTHDINSIKAVTAIGAQPESTIVYSGYGGVMVGRELLALGKRILHVHGGYLPDYKGSTTNYYSLLAQGTMGASAIFLTAEIDSGPILLRRSFTAPPERVMIDHLWDSAARAEVLVDTMAAYVDQGSWPSELEENVNGQTYYVVHPVLKHLAILSRN